VDALFKTAHPTGAGEPEILQIDLQSIFVLNYDGVTNIPMFTVPLE